MVWCRFLHRHGMQVTVRLSYRHVATARRGGAREPQLRGGCGREMDGTEFRGAHAEPPANGSQVGQKVQCYIGHTSPSFLQKGQCTLMIA